MPSRANESGGQITDNGSNEPSGSNPSQGATLAPPPRAGRPPARSNFDLEPNPFEHSFSSTSNVSQDTPKQDGTSGSNNSESVTNNATINPNDQNGNNANNGPGKHGRDVKPMLPPLAALESPADHGFGSWGLASSLRSGPLSPAMLAGPASQQTPSLGLGAFDSSFVRTGLTPDVNRTGLTPLIGGPGGFPPPSPNTAALFALVNGTSASGSLASNVAITPGTLNAITGVLGGHSMGGMHQPTSMSLDQQNQQLVDAQQQQHHQQQQQQQQNGQYHPHDYSHDSASHAISNAASALYLLSQQQNLQRHQNQQQQQQQQGQVNPSAVSGMPQPESPTTTANPASLGPTRRATKRKSTETPAPVPRGKKAKSSNTVSTRGATRKKSAKMDDFDEDMDDFDEDDEDDDMYMEGSMMPPGGLGMNSRSNSAGAKAGGGSRKPETEEEKRKNFLERNRQGEYLKGFIKTSILIHFPTAALKCRQRKKAWLTALQQKVEFLTSENERLTGALVTSREEIARLSQAVVAQGGAPSALLSEQSPVTTNGNLQNSMMGDGSSIASDGRERRNSASGSSTGAAHHQQQPVHVNVNVAMPNMPNGAQTNGTGGLGHGHSHSHSLPQAQQQSRGHSRAHSHGHNHVPANGVTVGGRGYGY